ncbi:MAG: hypothetical protein HC831_08285 [Chloroflexia bacterium]|nr:hypothetical protein [Chloroflexia bacterium]
MKTRQNLQELKVQIEEMDREIFELQEKIEKHRPEVNDPFRFMDQLTWKQQRKSLKAKRTKLVKRRQEIIKANSGQLNLFDL